MVTFILFIYLSTYSSQSGMTIISQEFTSEAQCKKAQVQIAKEFKAFGTQVKIVCAEK